MMEDPKAQITQESRRTTTLFQSLFSLSSFILFMMPHVSFESCGAVPNSRPPTLLVSDSLLPKRRFCVGICQSVLKLIFIVAL